MSATKKQRVLLNLATTLTAITTNTEAMSSFTTKLTSIQESIVTSTFPTGVSTVIGTHDGSFHCDEALAISMLKLLPSYRDATVLRSRNPALLAQCNIVVDVGAEYLPETQRFDHHQREFTGTLDGFSTKLSSAGLVYKHFGKEILREIITDCDASAATDEFIDVCYTKVYKDFMEHIDAIDNGISISDEAPRYHISTTLSARVGHLNPTWNQPQSADVFNENFVKAMVMTGSEFVSHVSGLALSWWPARSIVQRAIDERRNHHDSGSIIIFERSCPWKDHLFDLESLMQIDSPIVYAIYNDSADGSWRIQAVPVTPTSFLSRKKLPDEWCGLRDQALSDKVGLPGAIFIHASGFIGGHKTKEGALAMAIQALAI